MTGQDLCDYIKHNGLENFELEITIDNGVKNGWPDYDRYSKDIKFGDVSFSEKVFSLYATS